jgi:hypothetical protein
MNISESKLRKIVLEEVQLRLLDLYITEELERIFEEEGKETEDEDLQAYKAAAGKELQSYAKKGLIPMAFAAALLGYLGQETTSFSKTQAAISKARTQANIDAANTDDAQFDELVDQLNNQYAFRWGKGEDSVVHAPGSDGKITVLPPSYSVMVKVMQDKKDNAERMEQGLKPIQRYGEVDLDLGLDHDRQYKGDYEANIDGFFRAHQGDFADAMAVLGAHEELQVVPGSGTEEGIIMLDPNKISADYYLPELGMTAEDYYNYQYGEYMGSGEKEALDMPDEEMVVTPDDETELDQGLIDATNDRAKRYQQRQSNESKRA